MVLSGGSIIHEDMVDAYLRAMKPEMDMPKTESRQKLSISEVERLAKAGITMSWQDIRNIVVSDRMPHIVDNSFATPLIERLRVYRSRHEYDSPMDFSAFIVAVSHNDTAYVFAAIAGKEPVILTDDIVLYPSDALMAKIVLLMELHK